MSARTQAFIDLVRVGAIEPCLIDGRPGWRPADADPRALLIAACPAVEAPLRGTRR